MATAKEKREAREREAQAAERSQALNQEFMKSPGTVAAAAGEVIKPRSSGAKVTIGCKLGVAWIDLQLTKMIEKDEQTQTGIRKIREGVRLPGIVRIRGTSYPRGTPPDGFPARPIIIAGAAMNPGVDKDFWDEWKEQHKQDPLVVNGMIFAHENESHVHGQARETAANSSGLDPINPRNDARMPKATNADLDDVQTEEGRLEKMNKAGAAA